MNKLEILKKNITGYRGAIKQVDAIKAMEEYSNQQNASLLSGNKRLIGLLEEQVKRTYRATYLNNEEYAENAWNEFKKENNIP